MENTDELFFERNQPEWFVCVNETWIGPLTPADIADRIKKETLSFAHFVLRQGDKKWQRIAEVKSFQSLMPRYPSSHVLDSVKEQWSKSKSKDSSKSRVDKNQTSSVKEWFLFVDRNQTGPYSAEEVMRLLSVGKIDGKNFTWREGMQDWQRLQEIQSFKPDDSSLKGGSSQSSSPRSSSDRSQELRGGPRRPLVAKIVMANKNQVTAGICRDISVGGMQVLTDQIPGEVGSILKLNISPIGSVELKPFVADGEIVRILEDGRGFSFRFHRLSEESRSTIERYLGIQN